MSFLDLGPMSLIDGDLTFFSQKQLAHFQSNFKSKLVGTSTFSGYITKMAAMPIYGKTL